MSTESSGDLEDRKHNDATPESQGTLAATDSLDSIAGPVEEQNNSDPATILPVKALADEGQDPDDAGYDGQMYPLGIPEPSKDDVADLQSRSKSRGRCLMILLAVGVGLVLATAIWYFGFEPEFLAAFAGIFGNGPEAATQCFTCCPKFSTGANITDGCTCDMGYNGTILPSNSTPFYTGSCMADNCT